MRSFTQNWGVLKSMSMVEKKKLGGVWASPADLFLPGRQRGLEGGEPARGNSWERRRLGLVSRGSLFPSELMGSEDEPEPRQSSPSLYRTPMVWDPGVQEWAWR